MRAFLYKGVASLARAGQYRLTKLTLKVAKFAERMSYRAKNYTNLRLMKKSAKVIGKMNRPYSIRITGQIKRGKTTLSIYEHANVAGEKRVYWGLSRETPWGQKHLATGTKQDLKDFRSITARILDGESGATRHSGLKADQQPASGGTPHRSQALPDRSRTNFASQRPTQRVEPKRARGHSPGAKQKGMKVRAPKTGQASRTDPRPATPAKPRTTHSTEPSFTLVHVNGVNSDGSARAQVVANFKSSKALEAYRERFPALQLHAMRFDAAPRRGDNVRISDVDHPEVAGRLEQIRSLRAVSNNQSNVRAMESPGGGGEVRESKGNQGKRQTASPLNNERSDGKTPRRDNAEDQYILLCKVISVGQDGTHGKAVGIKCFHHSRFQEAIAFQKANPHLAFYGKFFEKEQPYGRRYDVARGQSTGITKQMDELGGGGGQQRLQAPSARSVASPALVSGHSKQPTQGQSY